MVLLGEIAELGAGVVVVVSIATASVTDVTFSKPKDLLLYPKCPSFCGQLFERAANLWPYQSDHIRIVVFADIINKMNRSNGKVRRKRFPRLTKRFGLFANLQF